jgi:hypothetical protein
MIEFTNQQHEHFENPINVVHAHYIAPKVSLTPKPQNRGARVNMWWGDKQL